MSRLLQLAALVGELWGWLQGTEGQRWGDGGGEAVAATSCYEADQRSHPTSHTPEAARAFLTLLPPALNLLWSVNAETSDRISGTRWQLWVQRAIGYREPSRQGLRRGARGCVTERCDRALSLPALQAPPTCLAC